MQDTLREIVWILPLESLQGLYAQGSTELRKFLQSEMVTSLLESRFGNASLFVAPARASNLIQPDMEVGQTSPTTKVNERCPLENSFDVCLRVASEEGSVNLGQTFIEGGATDISGALARAAEAGSYDMIHLLEKKATPDMFSMAAAHAALKGHLQLTKDLYAAGHATQAELDSILAMAVEGGHLAVIDWALENGANKNRLPRGLIGKNIEHVLRHLGAMSCSPADYLYGAASFGQEADLNFVLTTYPKLKNEPKTILRAFLGALENNNQTGLDYLSSTVDSIGESEELASHMLLSSARGNNLSYANTYARKAKKVIPALLVATARGNLEIVQAIKNAKPGLVIKSGPLYAAYSGSKLMVEYFADDEPSVEQLTLLAYGAAAGGNWDFLQLYLLSLEQLINQEDYEHVLQQVFAEAVQHSQLSLLNNLYAKLKDTHQHQHLRIMLEQAPQIKSKAIHLAPGDVHASIYARLDEILNA